MSDLKFLIFLCTCKKLPRWLIIRQGYISHHIWANLHSSALFQHQPMTHFFQLVTFFLSHLHPPCPMSHFAAVSHTFIQPPYFFDLSRLFTPRFTLSHLHCKVMLPPTSVFSQLYHQTQSPFMCCCFRHFHIFLSYVLTSDNCTVF